MYTPILKLKEIIYHCLNDIWHDFHFWWSTFKKAKIAFLNIVVVVVVVANHQFIRSLLLHIVQGSLQPPVVCPGDCLELGGWVWRGNWIYGLCHEEFPGSLGRSIYLLWHPNNTNVTRKPPLPATLCLPEECVGHRVSMTCAMILLCPSGSSWSREAPTTVACIYSLN